MKGKEINFTQLYEGDGLEICKDSKWFRFKCCQCGSVHLITIEHRKTGIVLRFNYDKKHTNKIPLEVKFLTVDSPNEKIVDYCIMKNGDIVVRIEGGESFWFDKNGKHPKLEIKWQSNGEYMGESDSEIIFKDTHKRYSHPYKPLKKKL